MDVQNNDEFYEDIVNISRVLPSISPLKIYQDLQALRDDTDRVFKILKKHFKSYNEADENLMSQDIRMIKRVLPSYPIVNISNDLVLVGNKKNRVQIVLKKYFDEENKPVKRSLSPTSSDEPEVLNKVQKIDETQTQNNSASSSLETIVLEDYDTSNSSVEFVQMQNVDSINNNKNKPDETIPSTSNKPDSNIQTIKTEIDNSLDQNSIETQSYNYENKLTNGDGKTFSEIILNLYPDIDLNHIKDLLRNIGIDISEVSDDLRLNVALNEVTTYLNTENKFEQVKTENETSLECSFESNHELTDSGATEVLSQDFNKIADVLSETKNDINFDDSDLNILLQVTNSFQQIQYTSNNNQMPSVYKKTENLNDKTENLSLNKTFDINLPKIESPPATLNTTFDISNFIKKPDKLENIVNNAITDLNAAIDTEINDFNARTLLLENNPNSIILPGSSGWVSNLNSVPTSVNIFKSNDILDLSNQNKYSNIAPRSDNWVKSALAGKSKINVRNTAGPSNLIKSSTLLTTNSNIDYKYERKPDRLLKHALNKPSRTNTASSTVTSANAIPNSFKNYREKHPLSVENLINSTENCNSVSNQNSTGLPNFVSIPSTSTNTGNFVRYLEHRNLNQPVQYLTVPTEENNQNPMELRSQRLSINFQREKELPNGVQPLQQQSLINNNDNKTRKSDVVTVTRINNKKKIRFTTKPHPVINLIDDMPSLDSATSSSADDNSNSSLDNNVSSSPDPITINLNTNEESNSAPLPSTSNLPNAAEIHPFYFKLLEMFPDICPDFLRNICAGKDKSNNTLDDIISLLLEGDYVRRERVKSPAVPLEFEEQYKTLLDLFPDADPTYLQHHCERLIDHPDEFKQFVTSLLEHKNYPSKEEYLKKMRLSAQQKQYTTEFDVKKFLEVIPNPKEYFKKSKITAISHKDRDYAITFLKNHYFHLTIRDITVAFNEHNSIVKSAAILDKCPRRMKSKRRLYPLTSCINIPLLQEIAYVKHKEEILKYIKLKNEEKRLAKIRAKEANILKTCECCYDDEVMPEDVVYCDNNHIFCKECVKKSCEIKIGEGKLDFPCLTDCNAAFSLQILQSVLAPKVFSKMVQRKQLEEVKSAGIEDLEFCPFCDFATIPVPGDKLFKCLNSDCMKESCRLCKEPSHIPLRCDEVEKENDVKLRTYIENKMTEALVRKCYKCGMKFIKEEGCNKMTCSCGAMMCYVCNQPVKDYKHFNGQGGDQYHLCPLYSDTNKLHMEAVQLSAENAKKELGIESNQLKIDPTADLNQHYKMLANKKPQQLPEGVHPLNAYNLHGFHNIQELRRH